MKDRHYKSVWADIWVRVSLCWAAILFGAKGIGETFFLVSLQGLLLSYLGLFLGVTLLPEIQEKATRRTWQVAVVVILVVAYAPPMVFCALTSLALLYKGGLNVF